MYTHVKPPLSHGVTLTSGHKKGSIELPGLLFTHKLCHRRTTALGRITKVPSWRKVSIRRHHQEAATFPTVIFLFLFYRRNIFLAVTVVLSQRQVI